MTYGNVRIVIVCIQNRRTRLYTVCSVHFMMSLAGIFVHSCWLLNQINQYHRVQISDVIPSYIHSGSTSLKKVETSVQFFFKASLFLSKVMILCIASSQKRLISILRSFHVKV